MNDLNAKVEGEDASDDAEAMHDFHAIIAWLGVVEIACIALALWSFAVNTLQRSNYRNSSEKPNKLDAVEDDYKKNDEEFLPGMQNLLLILVITFMICMNSHHDNCL